ncbi:hypothetical protein EJB05_55971, partial [Eragrostis curvula]
MKLLRAQGRVGGEDEGQGREACAAAAVRVHDQERGRPPRGRLPVAQVRPEGRQEQPVPQELLPLHDAAVPGEEAGGAVVPGPGGGDHHVRGQAHAPHPGHAPRQHPPPRRAGHAPPPPPPRRLDAARHGRGAVRAGRRHRRARRPPAAAARRRLPPRHAAGDNGFPWPCCRSDEQRRGDHDNLVAVSAVAPDAALHGAGLRPPAGHHAAVLRPQPRRRRRQHPAL